MLKKQWKIYWQCRPKSKILENIIFLWNIKLSCQQWSRLNKERLKYWMECLQLLAKSTILSNHSVVNMSKWSKRKSYKPNDLQLSSFFDNKSTFYAHLLMTFHLKNHHSLLCLITFYQKVLSILSFSSSLNFLNLVPYPTS